MRKKINIKGLLLSIALAEGVGLISSLFTMGFMKGYTELARPFFAPPGWVFGVVWSILYLLMGIAAYLVATTRHSSKGITSALRFYVLQLFFNFLWPIIFFRLDMRVIAFFEIIILLVLIIITTVKFFRINKAAGYLMLPYLLWVTFAAVLNYYLWIFNM